MIPLGILAVAGAGGAAAGAYELISTTLVSSAAGSVVFSSIPSTYKHLQLRWTARGINGSTFPDMRIQLNSDTGSNYAFHHLRGYGSAVDSSSGTSQGWMRVGSAPKTTTTSAFYGMVCDILDYASTSKNTTLRSLGGYTADGYDDVRLQSGVWMNTAAVSTVTIFSASFDIATGSRFSLYGIKG